jgi:argininosuccinate synthase
MQRIVLAYSGGLTSSIAIPWLADTYRAEVVAVTLDLGQGRELEEVRDRALATGAVRAHVLDARELFARDYLLGALKADAVGEHGQPLAAALAHPMIARKLIEIAGIEQGTAVAHACTGRALTRLEASARALKPGIRIVPVAREWAMTREQQFEYARQRHVQLPPGVDIDAPLLDDGNGQARTPAECPDEPADVEIAFEQGAPTAINGVTMPILDLLDSLGTIAAAHGIGRPKSRDLRDAPAAGPLHAAHRELRAAVTAPPLDRLCADMSVEYIELIESGLWFTRAREAVDAFFASVNERVAGIIRLKLFKGDCRIVEKRSGLAEDASAASVAPRRKLLKVAAVKGR